MQKRYLFLNRRAPYSTIIAQESLDMLLITTAFEQLVSIAFMDDGVFQLLTQQNPTTIGFKQFTKTFRALEDYDVEQIYVHQPSLLKRGVSIDDLLLPVILRDDQQMRELLESQDVVLSF